MPWIAPAVGAVASVIGAVNASNRASAPVQSAPPQSWVDPTQYASNLTNVQGALGQQKDLTTALQNQNALQNQSNVFNQLQGVASGTGPNPAQAMLANQTGANIAAQNALMAGQRGAGANPALIARQAAMQGSNLQQQSTGQAAQLQAQQSLGALGQMGGIAGQQAGQLLSGTQQYSNSALQGQQNLLNAQNQQNANAIKNADLLAGQTQANAGRQAQLAGNINNAVGTAIAGPLGSALTNALQTGQQTPQQQQAQNTMDTAEQTGGTNIDFSQGVQQPAAQDNTFQVQAAEGGMISGPMSFAGRLHHQNKMAKGGPVPALVSPGEKYLSPQAVQAVRHGTNPMAAGKTIPGKPKVAGSKNSYKNDTVPATLEEGGIVLPRSVTQAKDPAKKAAEFVAAVLRQKALKSKKKA